MESPVYCSWLEEERAEAEVNGKIENTRDIMRKYIARKFGEKSFDLQQKVPSMSNLEILTFVLEELFSVTTLDEARAVINDGIESEMQMKNKNN